MIPSSVAHTQSTNATPLEDHGSVDSNNAITFLPSSQHSQDTSVSTQMEVFSQGLSSQGESGIDFIDGKFNDDVIALRRRSKSKGSYSAQMILTDRSKKNKHLTKTESTNPSSPNRFPGQFKQIAKIGKSSLDEVFKATSLIDQQTYVIKILQFEDQSSVNRAIDEVRIFSTLSKHNNKNILRYYSTWLDHRSRAKRQYKANNSSYSDNKTTYIEEFAKEQPNYGSLYWHLFIQMEHCETTLSEWLSQRNSSASPIVDIELSKNYAKQILKGVEFMHKMNIVHRDLRPSNIFIKQDESEYGTIKIGDFGISVTIEAGCKVSQSEYNLGQYYYTPPEVEISDKFDVFSTGIVFCELAMVFKTYAERHFMLKSIKESCSLPVGFQPNHNDFFVIVSMISKNPEERPSSSELSTMMSATKFTRNEYEKKNLRARIEYLEAILKKNDISF